MQQYYLFIMQKTKDTVLPTPDPLPANTASVSHRGQKTQLLLFPVPILELIFLH